MKGICCQLNLTCKQLVKKFFREKKKKIGQRLRLHKVRKSFGKGIRESKIKLLFFLFLIDLMDTFIKIITRHAIMYAYVSFYVYVSIYVYVRVCVLSSSVVSNSLQPHGL